MELSTLTDLYIHELQDLYSAETQLLEALPLMADAASDPDLKAAFETHLAETGVHVSRLEEVLSLVGADTGEEKCKGMEGLLKEARSLMEEEADPEVLDAGLIVAAQKVEHYEIAGYGSVGAFAELLEEDEAVEILSTTLEEERATDGKLTDLAMTVINVGAATQKIERLQWRADFWMNAPLPAVKPLNPAAARHPDYRSLSQRRIRPRTLHRFVKPHSSGSPARKATGVRRQRVHFNRKKPMPPGGTFFLLEETEANSPMEPLPPAIKILILDGSPSDREACCRSLDRSALPGTYQYTGHGVLKEAIDRVREEKPDCILLDCGLPDGTGLDFLRRLREEDGGDCAVVMLTRAGGECIVDGAIRTGAQDCLAKDTLTPGTLHRAVGRAIALVRGRRALEARLRETERLLCECREENERRGHLLLSLSHELRTPLTSVMVGAGLLHERHGHCRDIARIASMILHNAEQQARVIDTMLGPVVPWVAV
ncbi:MAG: ferritin-like protein [Verrucomicrobiales bacterium]|nr:ferritin-like protein [Verrucomicrobiales bacterium]